jgi:two-component system vancomycin resistance associated response regulator VraR
MQSIARIDGAIIDVMLPDGSGLDFAEELREQHPITPMLILTGHAEPEFINRAHSLRAEYVCKPFFQDNLKEFLRRVVQAPNDDQWKLSQTTQDFATKFSLSMRETEIVSLACTGVPRSHIAEVLGVSENTIKTQVRSILDKTRQSSLSDVVWMVRQPRD